MDSNSKAFKLVQMIGYTGQRIDKENGVTFRLQDSKMIAIKVLMFLQENPTADLAELEKEVRALEYKIKA